MHSHNYHCLDYWCLCVSAVQQRHLADEPKGLAALAVVPAALEQHHTVLVLPSPCKVVGLASVPVGILHLTPVSPAPCTLPLAVCQPNPVGLCVSDVQTHCCLILITLEHSETGTILGTVLGGLPLAQLWDTEHLEGKGACHGVALWHCKKQRQGI